MSQLSWRHQTLIQALISRGPLQESDFHSVFFGVTGKNPASSVPATTKGKAGGGNRPYFPTDIPSCDICNEAGVKAATCAKEDCPVRIHDCCLKKKFSRRKVARICPGCGSKWPIPDGNGDLEEGEGEEGETTRNGEGDVSLNNRAKGKRLRSMKAEAIETVEVQSQPPSSSALRKRLRRCKTEAVNQTQDAEEMPRRSIRSRR